jgi:uncharacterized membrane protein
VKPERTRLLERIVEVGLSAGLALSGLLLLLGLALGSEAALRMGTVFLMATPVVRVLIVTVGLLAERDWYFGLISLWVLGVLATSIGVAFHLRP